MTDSLFQFGLTAFVTLIVVVDPFGVVPIFTVLTAAMGRAQRQAVLTRSVVVACAVTLFFLLVGRAALSFLGVTVPAFAISGGILLFATALPMLFGQRPGLQGPEAGETPPVGDDVSIFPLAIPLLAGPGVVTSILLLTAQAHGQPSRFAALALAVSCVFAASWLVLRVGERLLARIGAGGIHVATRVLGIVLAALAVQYVLNGLTGYWQSLR